MHSSVIGRRGKSTPASVYGVNQEVRKAQSRRPMITSRILKLFTAALIRDTVYLDGGNIWWSPGLASGEQVQPVDEGSSAVYFLVCQRH